MKLDLAALVTAIGQLVTALGQLFTVLAGIPPGPLLLAATVIVVLLAFVTGCAWVLLRAALPTPPAARPVKQPEEDKG